MTDMWRERTNQVGWALLPLRAFLAFVFIYGGISKIADRSFLDTSAPLSMHASLVAVREISPIGGLLGPVEAHSFAFGVLMAGAETAVGLGMLLGLFTRVAAVGGMLITVSLWLTVSWGARPWYTSADLVYVFAFTALLIAGAGGVLSADAWLAQQRAARPGVSEDRTRRAVLAAAVAVLGATLLNGSVLFRRSAAKNSVAGGSRQPTGVASIPGTVSSPGQATGSSSAPAASGPVLATADEVPVGGAHKVTNSSLADTVWVMQLQSGKFTALDATCPHQGCPVNFVSAQAGFVCPCHQSSFDASGKVLSGPASSDLKSIPLSVVGQDIRST
ncbi:MAG: Rieske 2Fe-2S domain-containing protein [Pseudonocardiales bacterium]